MTEIFNGKEYCSKRVVWYPKKAYDHPRIVVLVFGDDPASALYVKNKEASCAKHDIECITYHIPVSYFDKHWLTHAQNIIEDANETDEVVGIMVQLPIPQSAISSGLDERIQTELIDLIKPSKDIDGMTTTNIGLLRNIKDIAHPPATFMVPATARGIVHILNHASPTDGKEYAGKNAVVIGRSNIVGRPVAVLLERYFNMNVTLLHSHTSEEDLRNYLKNADVVVSAVGKPQFIKGDMLKEGVVMIDAGTSYIEKDGKRVLVGDVDFNSASPMCSFITPVPNGVGVVTVQTLIENILVANSGELRYWL